MHAGPENCHSIRCARTPHSDGDETNNLSLTPGILHTRRHLVLRWMASAFPRTEERFNRFMGHGDLWALEAILKPAATASQKAA